LFVVIKFCTQNLLSAVELAGHLKEFKRG